MMHIKGVIFDLDGTLVKSSLDFQKIRRDIGCPAEQDLLEYVANLRPSQQQHAEAIILQHEQLDAQSSHWIEGAENFVQQLMARRLPLAIVTRNSAKATAQKCQRNNIPIELIMTREHAPAKPDPQALLNIAAHWQLPPTQVIYIGDYRYDVEAAQRAKMRSCLYTPNQRPDYANQADLCFSCYPSLWNQLQDFWG